MSDVSAVTKKLNEAVAHHQAGRLAEAETLYRQILSAQPNHPDALHLLGAVAVDVGNPQAGKELIEQALAIDPDNAIYHGNLGLALHKLGELEAAAAECEKAIKLSNGKFADAWFRLGNVQRDLGAYPQALHSMQQTLKLRPDYLLALNNVANILHRLGRLDEAVAIYRQVLQRRPDWAMAHANLGFTLLFQGNFEQGWAEYEYRLRAPEMGSTRFNFDRPRWSGGPLNGERLLIYSDQGFGDAFQFLRYIPLVARQFNVHITFGCQPELNRIARGIEGIEAVTSDHILPPHDLVCALMSLPYLMKTRLENIPRNVPYIRADPVLVEKWGSRLSSPPSAKLKVGLAWQGRKHPIGRSIPFDLLAEKILAVDGVQFVGLQKGADGPASQIIDFTDELTDFAETAGLIENLDLVISIDTAVAHLAGAMGKRTWILLQRVPDWRWQFDREDCLWYPTVRLFRQPVAHDWDTPLQRVAERLREEMLISQS